MRNLVDKINESFGSGSFGLFGSGANIEGFDRADAFTRSYNNQFGMFSNTNMRVLPNSDGEAYILTGSRLRNLDYSFMTCREFAISTPSGLLTAAEFIESYGFVAFDPDGNQIFGNDDVDFDVVSKFVSIATEEIKDQDFIVIF